MIKDIVKDSKSFGKRSLVESIFSSFKQRIKSSFAQLPLKILLDAESLLQAVCVILYCDTI